MMFCGARERLQRKAQARSFMSSSAKDDELQPPVGERVEAVPQQYWEDNFVAGATASLLSKVVLQPLDFAKTLLQVYFFTLFLASFLDVLSSVSCSFNIFPFHIRT
jgi:hypothetical protein